MNFENQNLLIFKSVNLTLLSKATAFNTDFYQTFVHVLRYHLNENTSESIALHDKFRHHNACIPKTQKFKKEKISHFSVFEWIITSFILATLVSLHFNII